MPVMVARLATQEVTEPSEELRLSLVTFLVSLVDLCAAKMAPYLNDLVCVLQRTLVDPYPEVKKVGMIWMFLWITGTVCCLNAMQLGRPRKLWEILIMKLITSLDHLFRSEA